MSLIFVIHLVCTLFMLGLIWVVQLVIYPLFADIPESTFPDYENKYQQRITWIVFPVMSLELVTGVSLLFVTPTTPTRAVLIGNLLGIVCIWISTACLQVPCHKLLQHSFQASTHRKLVVTNWVRTVLWSLRSLLLAGGLVSYESKLLFSMAATTRFLL